MSIFASMQAPCDRDHTDECALWDKTEPDSWEFSGRPCDCGQPGAPIVYKGSHVLPEETDERGGWVDIALIPPHVRYWRENPDAPTHTEPDTDTHPPEPFLRWGVNNDTVILTREQVKEIHAELTWWLGCFEREPAHEP